MTATRAGDQTDDDRVQRKVAVSTLSQLGARVVHLALNVVSTLAIIHYLAPSDYGDYILVLSVTMLVGLLADFGLSKLAVREIARDEEDEAEILGTVVVARLALALVAVVLTQGVLALLGASSAARLAGLVASGLYGTEAALAVAVVFHVRVAQQYEAFVRVGMEAFETAVLLVLIARGASLPWLFAAPLVAGVLGAVVAIGLARRRFGTRFRFAPSRLRPLLREALPIGPALLIGVIYLKLDALILAALGSQHEVGLYGSAYQPIEYLFLASAVVINVLFPLLARAHTKDPEAFERLYRRGAEVLVGAMLLVPVTLAFVGEPLLEAVYGADYAGAARPLRILALTLVLMVVNGWQAFVLLAGDRQRVTLAYNAAALAVAIVVDIVLISAYGVTGAALATLVTATFVLACSTVSVRRLLHTTLDVGRLSRLVAAALLTTATLWAATALGTPWGALMPLAVCAYAALVVITGALSVAEIRALWSNRPGRAGALVDDAVSEGAVT